jgi:CheY-like chemotaxis protein
VALSGYGQEEDLRRSYAAGFFAHLVKPVDLDALKVLLDQPELASHSPMQ